MFSFYYNSKSKANIPHSDVHDCCLIMKSKENSMAWLFSFKERCNYDVYCNKIGLMELLTKLNFILWTNNILRNIV